jgi:hypothetical protein
MRPPRPILHTAIAFFLVLTAHAQTPHALRASIRSARPPVAALWQNRGDVRSLDTFHGSGGRARRPSGDITFVKTVNGGTTPKFEVVDGNGVRWIAKLGPEGQSETAATRLIWAAGYFTDDDYFEPQLRVKNLNSRYVSSDGFVRGVRLERLRHGDTEDWSWFNNRYAGTREMNGLRVLMALTNNWDLKKSNNSAFGKDGAHPRVFVSDLGATFGRTGHFFTRSKSDLADYRASRFVQRVKPETVDFHMESRPFFLTIFNLPNYITRTRMQAVAKDIPRDHARWIGQRLGQLSHKQVRDCFRAGGYTPEEAEGFAQTVEARIAELNRL